MALNARIVLLLAGAAFVAVIGLATLFEPRAVLYSSDHQTHEQEAWVESHEAAPDSRTVTIATPAGPLEVVMSEPKPDIQAEARDRALSDADTNAQIRMAFWARVVAYVSTGGLILIGLTLWETVKTGRAAEEALREQRKISQAEVRAYLSITKLTFQIYEPEKNIGFIEVQCLNAGNSPGRKMIATVWLKLFKLSDEAGTIRELFCPIGLPDLTSGLVLGQGQRLGLFFEKSQWGENYEQLVQVDAEVVLQGEDVFEGPISAFSAFRLTRGRDTKWSELTPLGVVNPRIENIDVPMRIADHQRQWEVIQKRNLQISAEEEKGEDARGLLRSE